jgi:hypothetical protein
MLVVACRSLVSSSDSPANTNHPPKITHHLTRIFFLSQNTGTGWPFFFSSGHGRGITVTNLVKVVKLLFAEQKLMADTDGNIRVVVSDP